MGASIGIASSFVTSTNSVSLELLSLDGFQRVSQLPDDRRSTVTGVVTVASISPEEQKGQLSQSVCQHQRCIHPIFFIAILNLFQVQRYLPPWI